MNERTSGGKANECFYGTATLGERGQIVIPADLRKALELQPGDKLLIMKHPSGKGIMLFHADSVREFMTLMLESLDHAEGAASEHHEDS